MSKELVARVRAHLTHIPHENVKRGAPLGRGGMGVVYKVGANFLHLTLFLSVYPQTLYLYRDTGHRMAQNCQWLSKLLKEKTSELMRVLSSKYVDICFVIFLLLFLFCTWSYLMNIILNQTSFFFLFLCLHHCSVSHRLRQWSSSNIHTLSKFMD